MSLSPFDIAFGGLAAERFPGIRESLASRGTDPHDLDAFVLDREVTALLRDLVSDDPGEGADQHLILLHHAYLYWLEGGWWFRLARSRTLALLEEERSEPIGSVPRAYYMEFPERLMWAELQPGEPPEPLEGMFIRPWPTGGFFVLGIFGMHPGRQGFTVVDVDGYPSDAPAREDGSASFSPRLPGGAAAGLLSLVGQEEILELAARTAPLVQEAVACAGAIHRPHVAIDIG